MVLISVDDLYIQYDVPKGYNIDSLSRANLLIAQANDTMSKSFALANLSIGESFTYRPNSDADNVTEIVIGFCDTGVANDTLDYSIISIFLNDGTQQSTCYRTENRTVPSAGPTMSLESSVPSTVHSSVPSEVPSNVPSMRKRSIIPSPRPTSLPENATTYIPSPLRTTLVPSELRSVTVRPTENPSASQISSAYHTSGRRWPKLAGLMELSALSLVTPMAIQYVVHWTIVQW